MRTYSSDSIAAHAYQVQERMFYTAVPFALVFIVFALLGEWRWAVVMVAGGFFSLGASAGAWLVAERLKD